VNVDGTALGERCRRQSDHGGSSGWPVAVGGGLGYDAGDVGAEYRANRHAARAGVVDVAAIERHVGRVDQHLITAGDRLGDVGEGESDGCRGLHGQCTHV
jgi:hypothetical protein